MANYEALFTPFKIGSCEIRNRVIIPAMEGTNIVENMYGPHYNEKGRSVHSRYDPRLFHDDGQVAA